LPNRKEYKTFELQQKPSLAFEKHDENSHFIYVKVKRPFPVATVSFRIVLPSPRALITSAYSHGAYFSAILQRQVLWWLLDGINNPYIEMAGSKNGMKSRVWRQNNVLQI